MSEPGRRRPVVQFLAWLLMAVGVLIALTTGGCTLYVLAGLAANGSGGYGSTAEWVLLSLFVGGLPCLVGIALFFGGRRLSRPPGTATPPTLLKENDDEPTTGA